MATIRDVAKKAGVSIATVSRVLNGSSKVSEKTREKVLKAVRELGYSPRPWAKYLALPRGRMVAGIVVTKRIKRYMKKGAFYHEVMKGVKLVSKESGVQVALMERGKESEADGYLLIGADFGYEDVERIRESFGKPLVLVDNHLPGLKIDAVISDGYGGAMAVVDELVAHGMKRIVHIHSILSVFSFRERFNGYVDAMHKSGLMPKFYEFDDVSDNMSYVVDLMLNSYGVPQAIFTSNDFAAVRLMKELKKRGLNAPVDPYIVGFDDSPEAERYGISSVRVFKSELGSFGMRRLITLMLNQDTHPAKISLFTELVMRAPLENI